MPTKVTSVHFLKTKLVVGMSNHGFEVVDIETLNTQPLLDPTVSLRELRTAKCLAICRYPAGNEFLLCYDGSFFHLLSVLTGTHPEGDTVSGFACYINRSGLLSRSEVIRWRRPIQALSTFTAFFLFARLVMEEGMLDTQRGTCTGFKDPYVFAFSPTHIEVRYIETGVLVQTIWIKHSLLSTSPEFLMIQAQDGRLIGLDFSKW